MREDSAGAAYGDLWAQALATDVFQSFVLDLGELGGRFRRLLAAGGGRSPGAALQELLGRAPRFAALLADLGLNRVREAVEEEEVEEVDFEEAFPEDDSYAEFEA